MMSSTRSLIYSMTYCDFPLQLTGLLWLWDQGEKKCVSTEILGFVQDGRKAYTVSAATLFIRGKLKNHVIRQLPFLTLEANQKKKEMNMK